VNASPIAIEKMSTPKIQTIARPCRHAAIQYWPHRWSTMQKKKSWTLQKWMLLTKRPALVTCHQVGPKKTSTIPLPMTHVSEAIAHTPNM
jgi:hypothetical protein